MRKALLLLPLLLLGLGCHNDKILVGGKPKLRPRGTVISLAPSTTELAMSFNSTYRLIGRTSSCNYPVGIEGVQVVAEVKPHYEEIVSLQPEVIVYDPSLYSAADIAKLKPAGATLVPISGDTIDQFINSLFELAKALHCETTVSEYVDKITRSRATAQADPMPGGTKVALLLPSPKGLGMVAGQESFQADEIKAAGATPVGPSGKMFLDVSPEGFLEMNPDFIVLAVPKSKKDAASAVESLMKDPRFQNVTAIKKKQIIPIDEDVLVRRGARVDALIDLLHRQLGKVPA